MSAVPTNWPPKPPTPRPVVLVRVTDIDLPFVRIIGLLIQLMLAAIPAVLLATLIILFFITFFGTLLRSALT